MALKDTAKALKSLLETILSDLEKAEAGNKAAAQRVRTQSIKFEKTAKVYRRESIKADKNGAMKKAKEANRKKGAPKPTAMPKAAAKTSASLPAKKRAPAKKVTREAKKPTAKIPMAKKKKK